MFEDYLEDCYFFTTSADALKDEREAKRHYRAAIFYAMGAIEAFINYVADTFSHGNTFKPHEIAVLSDRAFALHKGRFQILDQTRYHKLEDKIRFLLCKFVPGFDFEHESSWCQFLELKKLRDKITHPRQDEDLTQTGEYKKKVSAGLSAEIDLMNRLCQALFSKPLRKKLLDMRL